MQSRFGKKTFELIKEYGYELILDEELDCIESHTITRSDANLLLSDSREIDQSYEENSKNGDSKTDSPKQQTIKKKSGKSRKEPTKEERKTISVAEDGRVSWLDSEYTGRLNTTKHFIENGTIFALSKEKYVWLLSTDLMECFENITIITYLYNYSLLYEYLKLKGYTHEFFYVKNGEIIPGFTDYTNELAEIRSKINIYEGSLNNIGDHKSALSVGWYRDNSSSGKMDALLKNGYNYLHNRVHSDVSMAMWSVFKGSDGVDKVSRTKVKRNRVIKDYASSELPCNARASNDYRERTNLAYLCNLFLHPFQTEYFSMNDVQIDVNGIALSRLVQWVWRSAIREGKPINLYLPSSRMRKLFISWLNHEAYF